MTGIQPSTYTDSSAGLSFFPNSAIFDSPVETRVFPAEHDDGNQCSTSATSTTSSIGKNSDHSVGGGQSSSDGEDENEVQSSYKRTFGSMVSLEQALPMRRGISKFYDGKSKSFTILAEASSSSSIKDIAKAENAYSRKRRNLLASSHIIDKSRSSPDRSTGEGISKRPNISSRKSTLAAAVAMSSSESTSSTSEDSSLTANSKSPPHLPPFPRDQGLLITI